MPETEKALSKEAMEAAERCYDGMGLSSTTDDKAAIAAALEAFAAERIGYVGPSNPLGYRRLCKDHAAVDYRLARAWGFSASALLTGCKAPMGLGFGGAYVPTTEHVLFARRGSDVRKARWDSTWFHFKRGEHSRKPDVFIDIVEQVSPGPYLELFARRQRLGWDTWGDECFQSVSLPQAAPATSSASSTHACISAGTRPSQTNTAT